MKTVHTRRYSRLCGSGVETQSKAGMVLAYHRVPSNAILDQIASDGQILPAAMRLDPEVIRTQCLEPLENASGPGAEAVKELVEEAVEFYSQYRGEASRTGLLCEDLLAGDGGRIFLSPGNWAESTRALGWPASGFAFDAEALIEQGARFREDDLGSKFKSLLLDVLQNSPSKEEGKENFLEGVRRILDRYEVGGQGALDKIQAYKILPGQEEFHPYERRQSGWARHAEIVWEGPLGLDLIVETWKDDRLI